MTKIYYEKSYQFFFYIADLEQIKKFNKKRNNYKIK